MSSRTFLITGRNGQLARAFLKAFEKRSIRYMAPGENEFDITDPVKTDAIIGSCRPDVVINCAAYNLVDKAEQEPEKAFLVNATGAKNLARAAQKQGAWLVHFGSDYVFDGSKENGLYGEGDPVNPLNVYGKSKLDGENIVEQEAEKHLILRLSWVYGDGMQNFLHKLREWSRTNKYLKIACDEFSVPTSTRTIVDITMTALEKGLSGMFHLVNTGYCSRYEWAKLALSVMGINKFIRPVSMIDFNLPAKRPMFSAMSNDTLSRLLDVRIPAWEEAVAAFLREQKDT